MKRPRESQSSVTFVRGYRLITLTEIRDNENHIDTQKRITELDNYSKCFTEYFKFLETLLILDNIRETYVEKMLKDSNPFLYFIIAFIFHNINIILDNQYYFEKFKPIFQQLSNILNRINMNWSRDLVEVTNYNNKNMISKQSLELARKKIFENFKRQGKHDQYRSFRPNITSQDIIKNTELVIMFDELQKYIPNLVDVEIVRGRGKTKKRKKKPKKKKLETKKKIHFKKLRKHITQRLKPRFKIRSKLRRSKTIYKPKKTKQKIE